MLPEKTLFTFDTEPIDQALDPAEATDDEDELDGDDDDESNAPAPDADSDAFQREPQSDSFDLNGPEPQTKEAQPEEDQLPAGDLALEFLHCHHRLGHMSPTKMKMLASKGIIPKRLLRCPVPACTSCLCGKAK